MQLIIPVGRRQGSDVPIMKRLLKRFAFAALLLCCGARAQRAAARLGNILRMETVGERVCRVQIAKRKRSRL